MSVKSEPMDFDQESLAPLVIPTHLVVNSTVPDDLSVMQTTTADITHCKGRYNDSSQPVTSAEQLRSLLSPTTMTSTTKAVKRHSKFDTLRVRTYAKTVLPSFSINREEIELNSKLLPKKYMCGFCVYKTSYKSDLNRHLRRHNQRSNFHCQLCNMPFRTEGLVYHHIRTAHSQHMQMPSADKYVCDVCNKSFVTQSLMVQHKASAHGVISCSSQPVDASGDAGDTNAATRFQKSPMSSEDSLRPPSYEPLTVDDDSMRSSYCSDRGISNGDRSEDFSSCPKLSISPVTRGVPAESVSRDMAFGKRFAESGSQRDDMTGLQNDASLVPSARNSNPNTLHKDRAVHNVGKNGGNTESATSESNGSVMYNRTRTNTKIPPGSASSLNPSTKQQNELVSVTFSPQTGHYTCEICGLIFKTLHGILNHKASCKSEDLGFACSLCPFQTSNVDDFAVHREKHSSARYCCEICNRPFVAMQNLLKHKRFFHGNTPKTNDGFSAPLKPFSHLPQTPSGVSSLKLSDCSPSAHRNQNDGVHNSNMHSSNRPSSANYVPRNYSNELHHCFQSSASNPGNTVVTSQPPESGRYAKLVSDFDDFATRPYACALCFFRTSDVTELSQHVKNHLTGCNTVPIPESARFVTTRNYGDQMTKTVAPSYDAYAFTAVKQEIHEQLSPNCEFSVGINDTDVDQRETKEATVYQNKITNSNKSMKRRKTLRRFTKGRNHLRRYPFSYKSGLPGSRFPCESCNKSFSVRILLTRHVKNVH